MRHHSAVQGGADGLWAVRWAGPRPAGPDDGPPDGGPGPGAAPPGGQGEEEEEE